VQTDPVQLIAAIVDADGTGKMPDEVTIRLLLAALGVKNVDEEIEKMRDEDGNIADPRASAGDDATRRFRQGEDPASELA
jgi:ribosomal protein L12E/L44/L45/RPP1/RPP2